MIVAVVLEGGASRMDQQSMGAWRGPSVAVSTACGASPLNASRLMLRYFSAKSRSKRRFPYRNYSLEAFSVRHRAWTPTPCATSLSLGPGLLARNQRA